MMSDVPAVTINIGDLISSPTTIYKVQRSLGTGSYGMVTQCTKMSTNELVTIKFMESSVFYNFFAKELATLNALKEFQSERFNIVRLNDSFYYKGHFCLEFEQLDGKLSKFMQMSPGQHLHLKQIRPILQQIAMSLLFLRRAGVVHTDLRPQNIMMVDQVNKPLTVRLTEFGLAFTNPAERVGQEIQSLWYRSPEVVARQPFSGAIDVWSLGCIAAELILGVPLFRASDEHDLMRQIQYVVGNPFGFCPKYWMESRFPNCWLYEEDFYAEQHDLASFIDLLMRMLTISQFERITPEQILQHPFITMMHLDGVQFENSLYVTSSKDLMEACHHQNYATGGQGSQTIQPTSIANHEVDTHTTAGCWNREDESKPKKSGERAAPGTKTSVQKGPQKTQKNKKKKKKRRDDLASEIKSSKKKKNTTLNKKLKDNVNSSGQNSSKSKVPPNANRNVLPKKMNEARTNGGAVANGQTDSKKKRKRKHDDPAPDSQPSKKKKNTILNKQVRDNFKNLSQSEAALSSSTQDHSIQKKKKKKNKEADNETTNRQTCPKKSQKKKER